MSTKDKAIFFDKDGTLIENVPYNVDSEKISLYDDIPEALKRLQEHGYKIIIITNQAGVAYGYFKEEALTAVDSTIRGMLEKFNIKIDGFYYCPHHTQGKIPEYSIDCICRKPKPGLINKAAVELNIDLAKSWMVGDILNDVEAGNLAGCKSILIDNGNETEWILNEQRKPAYIVSKVSEAVDKIIGNRLN